MENTGKKYLMRIDPTEEEVNALMDLGYSPIAITPKSEEFIKNGIYKTIETKLVYHFVLKVKPVTKGGKS